MNTRRFLSIAVPVSLVGGCAAMEAMGLATTDGQPTEKAAAVSDVIKGFSGIDLLAIWKAGEALLTSRGRDNLKNVFTTKSGFVSSAKSVGSIIIGSHTPPEAVEYEEE